MCNYGCVMGSNVVHAESAAKVVEQASSAGENGGES